MAFVGNYWKSSKICKILNKTFKKKSLLVTPIKSTKSKFNASNSSSTSKVRPQIMQRDFPRFPIF
jgi:hypothetical protein